VSKRTRSPMALLALVGWLIVALFAAVAPLPNALALGNTYYVALNGNDLWSGTLAAPNGSNTDGPFRTIQRAANAASAGDTVQVRAGTYRETVTPPNSGTAANPLIFTNYPGETAIISGADVVSGSWSSLGNGLYSIGSVAGFSSSINQAQQLFLNGQMLNEARFPNTGLDIVRSVKLITDDALPAENVTVLTTEGGNPVMVRTTIYDSALTNSTTDAYKGMTISIAPEVSYQFITGQIVASALGSITFEYNKMASDKDYPEKNDPYFLFGKADNQSASTVVDGRAEWYRDPATNTLYLRTPLADSPAGYTVEVKRRDYAFDLSERSYVTVQGLHLFAATITTDILAGDGANGAIGPGVRQGYDNIASANHIVIDGIRGRYLSHFTDLSAFVYTQWANNSGIILSGSDNELKNSILAYSAGNGVSATGVRHKIINNIIHDIAYAGCECAAIMTGFNNTASRDHEIAYNTAYNSGKNLVLFRNLENTNPANPLARIHHNDFSNAALSGVQDTGVLYTWSDSGRDLQGLEIDHNLLYDAYDEVAGASIYLDGSISNIRVHHNVMWNSSGINSGGRNNLIYNNTINGAIGSNIGDNENTFIRNNIVSSASFFNTANWVSSDNLAPTISAQYCDSQAGNFALRSHSAARNTGATIAPYTNGFLEGNPDKGAYEYNPSSPCVRDWSAGSSLSIPTPLAPSQLEATASTGRVDLRWVDNASNEAAYYVERNTGGHIWTVIAVLPANSTTYADTNLLGGTYLYRVRADNSPYSVLVTIGTGRSALGRFLANSFDDYVGVEDKGGQRGNIGEFSLNDWMLYRSVNFPAGITTVKMELDTWSNCNNACRLQFWVDALPTSAGGSGGGTMIAELLVNWPYPDFSGFREFSTSVISNYPQGVHDLYVTLAGTSDMGNMRSFQFLQGASTPTTPGNLSATGGNGQASLSWSDTANNEDLYKVERSLNQLDWVQVAVLPANTTSYIDAGLSTSTSYSYRVRAFNSLGDGEYTNPVSATTSASSAAPAVPSAVSARATGPTSLQVNWYDTSATETGFTVERATNTSFTSGLSSQNVGANVTSATFTGLSANTTYYVRVRSSNGAGNSANSASASVVTAANIPASPTNPLAKTLSAQRIAISWQDSVLNETEFAIERSLDGNTGWAEIGRIAAGGTQYIDSGLNPVTTYYYRVRALNGSGSSAYSVTTSTSTRSSRPGVNVQIEAETFDNVSTNNNQPSVERSNVVGGFDQYDWVMLRDVDFGGGIDNIIASVAADSGGKQLELRIDERLGTLIGTLNVPNTGGFGTFQQTSSAPSFSPTGIHDLYLISKNQGAFNLDWVRFNSNNSQPVAPNNVRIPTLAANGTQLQVSWNDNASNESGFTIERNASSDEAAGSWVQAGTVGANVTSFTDTGLAVGATYSYRVKATNSFGSSAYNSTSGDRIWRATTRVGHPANTTIQAEAYQLQNNSLNNWLYGLSGLDDGDWVMYSDVALNGVTSLNMTLATPNSGNTIEVRTGSPTGTLLGTLNIASTGDYGTYATQSVNLSGASGTANVYLVFRGGYGIANLDALSFVGSGPTPTNTPVPPTNTPTSTPTNTPTNTPTGGLPSPWQTQDVGTTGQVGSASFSGGTFTVQGAGRDIYDNDDSFRFVYQSLNGNGEIVARVASLGNTGTWGHGARNTGDWFAPRRDDGERGQRHDVHLPQYNQWRQQRGTCQRSSTVVGAAGAQWQHPYWLSIQQRHQLDPGWHY
jgi:hypothetical protein